MSKWIERLKSAEPPYPCTAKSAKSPPDRLAPPLLSVLSVPREGIAANEAVHLPGDEAEAERLTGYRHVALRAGFSLEKAEEIAAGLVGRDRDRDDRRMCLECRDLSAGGRCLAAGRAEIAGVDRRLEPVRTILQRCEAFAPEGLKKEEKKQ
jgi:hypothetical protein